MNLIFDISLLRRWTVSRKYLLLLSLIYIYIYTYQTCSKFKLVIAGRIMSEDDDSCVIIASGGRDDYCDTTSVGVFFMISQAM